MTFKNRSYTKELLDQDNIPFDDIKQNLKELNTINTLLGGHNISLQGVKQLLPKETSKPIRIVEIGCGGGDNLAFLQKKLDHNIEFIGVDIKENCIAYAKERYPNIEFICSDYKAFNQSADIIFSSLFCHHFTDEELIDQYKWMNSKAKIGFVINDLQRHPLAYYSIQFLTRLFSKSYLVKNDAPLSVRRGFHKDELQAIFSAAEIPSISISWKWAFRYLVVGKK